MAKWKCINKCFVQVDGIWQRVRPGQVVDGAISKGSLGHFEPLLEPVKKVVTKPKKVPTASEKSRKKELRRLIRKNGGQCTNFDSLKSLQEKYDAIK